MPDHEVKQGDTLVSIAHQHEWRDWEAIWNHDGNAQLREQRPDPQVLVPGDVVHVPEKVVKQLEIEAGKTHRFEAKVLTAHFECIIRDQAGNLLPNKRYRLEIEDNSTDGYTDDEAQISLDIDPGAAAGVLKVWLGPPANNVLTWNLQLGHLEPVDTTKGLQARLANLGFYEGKIDGELSDETKAAIRDFQVVYGLELSGAADDATLAKLREIHDNESGSDSDTTS